MTSGDQGAQPAHNENARSPLSQFMSKTIVKLPQEQPSRDEIAAKRQNSLDLFTSGRVLAEASTTSGVALKFAVCNLKKLLAFCMFVHGNGVNGMEI